MPEATLLVLYFCILKLRLIIIIIIIIIKNEKIRVTLCENAAGALYIVNKMCVLMVGEMCKGETSTSTLNRTKRLCLKYIWGFCYYLHVRTLMSPVQSTAI